MKKSILITLLVTTVAASAQTDLIYPWVTNNPNFRGTVIINNLENTQVEVTLVATRPAGNDPQTAQTILLLEPFEQRVTSAADLFPELGEGSAYTIRLTSTASNIQGGFINVGTQTSSGSSPSQANVFRADEASNVLLFNYMFINDEAGFAAPVVINMGDTDADVNFYTYQNGQLVGEPITVNVPAGTPFANVAGALAPPDTLGDLMMVAESVNPLLGTVFIFNAPLEPSMANAVPLLEVPDPGSGNQLVTFDAIVKPIIDATCNGVGCHSGPDPARGLLLEGSTAYDNLINVPSTTGAILVIPGDAENSYFYRKLLPPDGSYSGSRMPRLRPPLADEDIESIRQWILDGAPRN